jgi:hypothetical protein
MVRRGGTALAAFALSPPAVQANVIYDFQGGTPGSAQSAFAEFNFSDANHFALTLTNQSFMTSISSILDDFHFDLSGTPTSLSLDSIFATGGQETCTTTTGPPPHVTTCSNDPNTDATGTWGAFLTANHVDMFSNGTQIHPFGIANGTFITNASMDGLSNPQHNPVLMGPVTFDFTLTGLTDIPTISNVDFTFGTQPDHIPGVQCTDCQPLILPEPGTLALLALGLIALGGAFRRRPAA